MAGLTPAGVVQLRWTLTYEIKKDCGTCHFAGFAVFMIALSNQILGIRFAAISEGAWTPIETKSYYAMDLSPTPQFLRERRFVQL